MGELDRKATILLLVKKLKEKKSWCGETHIQKSAYVLHRLFDEFEDYDFILYKYGPYSFDLNADLTSMLGDSFLSLETEQKYGPKFCPGSAAGYLEENETIPKQVIAQIDFVTEQLGKMTVRELEPLATSLMLAADEDNHNVLVARLMEKKPHIDNPTALWAVEKANEIKEAASALI